MRSHRFFGAIHLGAGVAVAVALFVTVVPSRGADAPRPCCFTNERYSGTCSVVPGNDETCEGILAYLNNPNSTGRNYCGGTTIRGGWIQVDCSAGKAAAQKSPAGSAACRQSGKPAQTQGTAR
jgi:hypothetical protein